MATKKAGRPFVYQTEDERPVTVSLRVPHDLYAQVQRYVRVRPQMTMTEFLLDAARLKLETPTDPRDAILSDDNTVIQDLQRMVDEAVEAALAKRNGQAATTSAPMSAVAVPNISHDCNTVLQPSQEVQPQRKKGRQRSPEGQRVLDVLTQHPEGLSAEQIRGYLTPSKPLGDTLQGMKKTGAVRTEGTGKQVRYYVTS
jgi:DNA-directed RNA polymerase subunit L